MDSASLAQKLAEYNAKPVTATDALNEALTKYGVPEIRNTVSGLRTTVANTSSALNNVDPSVTGRTQGSLVTEAQRQRIVNNERAPIAQQLEGQTGKLSEQQQALKDALDQAGTMANNKVADYDRGRQALQGQYDMTYQREQDAAKAAAAAASEAEARRQFNMSLSAKASTGGGGSGGGGSAKMSTQDVTAAIRQGLNSVKGGDNHVAPKDLARAYDDWLGAGLSVSDFWKNFQGYWNPKQSNYSQQFYAAV